MVKGIDQDEVILFFPRFLEKLQTVLAMHKDPFIFRQAEKASGHVDDVGGRVDGINSAAVEMVREKVYQRSGANADNEDIAGFRHNQQGGEHMPGVRQNQMLGSGQAHSALQVARAEIEAAVVAVVPYFDLMAIPIFFVDNEARIVCHGLPCGSAACRRLGLEKSLPNAR